MQSRLQRVEFDGGIGNTVALPVSQPETGPMHGSRLARIVDTCCRRL